MHWIPKVVCHLLGGGFLAGSIIGLASFGLESFTHSGEVVVVPVLEGLSGDEAMEELATLGLQGVIVDSIYRADSEGVVVDQEPAVSRVVKPGRIIYLTTSMKAQPQREVPRLLDMNTRQAVRTLEHLNFTLSGVVAYPDTFPVVLEIRANDKVVSPGDRIPADAALELVIGTGEGYRDLKPRYTASEWLALFESW